MKDLSTGYALIGHAPADREFAAGLSRQLRARHIQPRFDERGAPTDQLIRLTRRADALLVVMTPAADDFEPLSAQIAVARSSDIPIYPIAIGDSDPMLELSDLEFRRINRPSELPESLLVALAHAVDAPDPSGRRKIGMPLAIGAAALAVLLAVVVTFLVMRRPKTTVAGPQPTGTAVATAGSVAAGQVTITSPGDGGVVKRCEHVSGAASLPGTDTIVYAVNRVSPPDKAWYYGYVGSYDNGFVPSTWTGDVYFGSVSSQRFDLFLYVMTVAAAHKFWNAHKSSDGSFAFGDGPPPGVRSAAHVRVTQGSLDEC
jgi:hypothetical protein